MAIRWDSVLVRDLARELDIELVGSRLRAIRLDARTRDVVLFFRKKTLVFFYATLKIIKIIRRDKFFC